MTAAALALALAAAQAPEPGPIRRVAVDLERHPAFDWRSPELDLVSPPRPGAPRAEILADDAGLARLRARGVTWTVLEADQVAAYAARLAPAPVASGPGAWLDPPFAGGALGGYYAWEEIAAVLDQVASAYPEVVAPRTSLGLSVEGRPLFALKVSDDPAADEGEPAVRIDALHHAREPAGMQAALWFLLWLVEGYGSDPLATYLVEEREIWIVPCANPDGYAYNQVIAPGGGGLWRKNRRELLGGVFGVDLNRNYPSFWGADDVGSSPNPSSALYRGPAPASEPEVQALVALQAERGFATAVTAHAYGDLWLHPFGYAPLLTPEEPWYAELGALATAESAWTFGPSATTLYLANGLSIDHDHAHGTLAWTAEIGSEADGFWPPTDRIVPLCERALPALRSAALAAGAYVRAAELAIVEQGDGDSFHEPGESVRFELVARNSGRAATAGPVTAALSAVGPGVTVSDGAHDFGPLPPSGEASTGATPLRIEIAPDAPSSGAASYVLRLAWEGYAQEIAGTLPLGPRRLYLEDDLELDLGWTAGAPGDDAEEGAWEHGEPQGTTYAGAPAHPEKDASKPVGELCWSTGNGGGPATAGDVDGGRTTLITPRIDLEHTGPALVRYARWFQDLGVADDALEVAVSADDGATWTPVETVRAGAPQWIEAAFLVPDLVAQTDRVRISFSVADDPDGSIVEAAVDELSVETYDVEPRLHVYGPAKPGATVALLLSAEAGAPFSTWASPALASFHLPGLAGVGELAPGSAVALFGGTIPWSKLHRALVALPGDPAASGLVVHLQSVVLGSQPAFSDRATLAIE